VLGHFRIPLSCLPSLAAGLVPVGHHYYEGSDYYQPPLTNPPAIIVSFSHPVWSLAEGAWNILKATFLTAHFDG
jgi:hypothetical protein